MFPENQLEPAIDLVTDPGRAKETLHWGRNYLYTVELPAAGGGPSREVVVKQFPGAGWRARWKRRTGGSKAARSWRAAAVLAEAGIATPEPLALVESAGPDGATFYVTAKATDFVESRYYFRAIARGNEATEFPSIDRSGLMRAIGRLFARLHEAGVWHRDLSIGNLLVHPRAGDSEPAIELIDLDRSRLREQLGSWTRLRDICRLPILETRDREAFWRAYWGSEAKLSSWRGVVFRCLQQGFLAKNRWKPRLRGPLRSLKGLLVQRKAYAHIPAAPADAKARDKAVWDPLSDQPHQHATKTERAAIRLADVGAHAAALGAVCAAAPRIWSRYRKLSVGSHAARRPWGGAGVAIRPLEGQEEELVESLERLGVGHVLLRLHPWQRNHDAEEALARELHARGFDLAYALPQNRELVRDLGRWRSAIEELAERFRPWGESFQIGQAINRSKWGVWNYREYLELAGVAGEILSRTPGTRLLGPAVIDFEFQATAAVLNMSSPVRFDAVCALLYVDRRGAPENSQLGFDTVAKCALLRAIAETAKNSDEECWVTEVNWPLWEGPHSPAGRTVSVDEERQASYLARYYLLTLTSGHVERVYWWQLVARGYGLIDPADQRLRRRPSFRALATLESRLAGATFVGAWRPTPNTRVLEFEVGGGALLAAWSVDGKETVDLERELIGGVTRDGDELETSAFSSRGGTVLGPAPVYFEVAETGGRAAIDSTDAD